MPLVNQMPWVLLRQIQAAGIVFVILNTWAERVFVIRHLKSVWPSGYGD